MGRSLTSEDVLDRLTELFLSRDIPDYIRSDNGPEFTALRVRSWLSALGVKTLFIELRSPWENGYCESSNGKLRDELLNVEIFDTLLETQVLVERWRRHYSTVRPHSSLGHVPPAPEAMQPRPSGFATLSPAATAGPAQPWIAGGTTIGGRSPFFNQSTTSDHGPEIAMKKRLLLAVGLLCLRLAGFLSITHAGQIDFCSPDTEGVRWEGERAAATLPPEVTFEDGAVKAKVVADGKYQGIRCRLDTAIDLSKYAAVSLEIRQGFYANRKATCVIKFFFDKSVPGPECIYGDFNAGLGEWTRATVPLEKRAWKGCGHLEPQFLKVNAMLFYPYSAMEYKDEFIEIRNIRFIPKTVGNHKIHVNNYDHINKPDSGDPEATILTDGIVDQSKQAQWGAYKATPEMHFDLGGIYLVDSVKLEAFAAPSHNIDAVTIVASNDKVNWYPLAVIENRQEGVEEIHQVLSADKLGIPGRYLKMTVSRNRVDHSVRLSEVSFFGRLPSEEELRQAAHRDYSVGPEMPAISEKDYLKVSADGIEFHVARSNGMIVDLKYNGKKLAERIVDQYLLSVREDDRRSDGYSDRVSEIETDGGGVEVRSTNPKLPGIRIVKRYVIDNGALERTITYVDAGARERAFLTTATRVVLSQGFRTGGVYETSGSSHSLKRLFAEEVLIDIQAARQPFITFEKPQDDLTLMHCRFRFDGEFLYFDNMVEYKDTTLVTPNGWVLTSALMEFGPGVTTSVTNRLDIVSGGLYDAYLKYINLPEPRAYRDEITRPGWLRDVVVTTGLGWEGLWKGVDVRMTQRVPALLREGYIVDAGRSDLNSIFGESPIAGEVRNWFGGRQTAEELKRRIATCRAVAPARNKIGIYTWLFSVFPYSKPAREHPEWFVWENRNGSDASWFPGLARNYLRFWDIPESRDAAVKQIVDMMNYYDLDVWYLDGGNGGTLTLDWETMRADNPLAKTKMYKAVIKEMRKTDPERIVFFNAPCNPLGDLGFNESFSGVMTAKWREGAAWMWKFKLFQVNDRLKYPVYIYWLPGVEGAFENYMVGTGLMPAYHSRRIRAKDIPYVTARYENRMVGMVDADVLPNWRTDPETDLEVMALRNGEAGILFVAPRAEEKKSYTVSALSSPLGLEAGESYHSWSMAIRDARTWDGRFGEPELEEIYAASRWAPDRVSKVKFLGAATAQERLEHEFEMTPGELQLWVVSRTPGFIWSIDNMRTQLWLPERPKLRLTGNREADNVTVQVDSQFTSAEIAVLIPQGKSPLAVSVDGTETRFRVLRYGEGAVAIVPVTAGNSEIRVSLRDMISPTERPELSVDTDGKLLKTALGESWHGKHLSARVELDGSVLWQESELVTGRSHEFALDTPSSLRKGTYRVVVSDLSGRQAAESSMALAGGTPKTVLPYSEMRALPVVSDVEPASFSGEGFDGISTGAEYTKGAGIASVDAAQARLSVGMEPMYESHYNTAAAGMEVQAKRFLKLQITSNFEYFNRTGTIQPKRHFIRYDRDASFAGMTLDFAGNAGYSTRSALGFGKVSKSKSDSVPRPWGTKKKPDRIFALNDHIHGDKESLTFWIDAYQIGVPSDWNGKLWISAVVQNLGPDRWMKLKLLESADALPPEAAVHKGHDLVNTMTTKIIPLTRSTKALSEVRDLTKLDFTGAFAGSGFTYAGNTARKSSQKTSFLLTYDDTSLFLKVIAEEKEKDVYNTEQGQAGKPWHSDSVEFSFTIGTGDDIHHVIVDADGNRAELVEEAERVGGKKTAVRWARLLVKQEQDAFVLYAAVPLEKLQIRAPLAGKHIGFNVMRNRVAADGTSEYLTFVPGPSYFPGRNYQLELR